MFFVIVAYEKSSRKKKSKPDSSENQTTLLDLAMEWDCIDVAKEFVLENSLDNIPVFANLYHFYMYII